jgi:hypothetical protein
VGGCHEQGLGVCVVSRQAEENDRAAFDSISLHPGGSTKHIIPDFFSCGELSTVQTWKLWFGFSQSSQVLAVKEGFLVFGQRR